MRIPCFLYCKTQVASHITARRRMHLEPKTGQPQTRLAVILATGNFVPGVQAARGLHQHHTYEYILFLEVLQQL